MGALGMTLALAFWVVSCVTTIARRWGFAGPFLQGTCTDWDDVQAGSPQDTTRTPLSEDSHQHGLMLAAIVMLAMITQWTKDSWEKGWRPCKALSQYLEDGRWQGLLLLKSVRCLALQLFGCKEADFGLCNYSRMDSHSYTSCYPLETTAPWASDTQLLALKWVTMSFWLCRTACLIWHHESE